jgi:hypothetical protein
MYARFDFGKHRGLLVEEVPTGYLRWCVRECENIKPWLRQAVQAELDRREAAQADARRQEDNARRREAGTAPGTGATPGASPPAQWAALVARWYRELALAYHPDRGGSHEQMLVVQDAYQRLKKLTGAS